MYLNSNRSYKITEINSYFVHFLLSQHVDMMRGQISNAERSLQAYLQPILSALQRVDIPESINIDIEAVS